MDSLPDPACAPKLKTCTKCGESKPEADYYVKVKATGRLFSWCKPCHVAMTGARSKQVYQSDLEASREAAKAKYAANPERAKAANRRHRQNNRDKVREAERAYKAANPDKIKAKKAAYAARRRHVIKAWNLANYERKRLVIRVKHKAWRDANPEVLKSMCRRARHKRRARVAGNGGSFTEAEWQAIKAAQGHRCLMCGMCEPLIKLTVDHIIPLSKGGTSNADNLQPLCGPCNSSKQAKILDLRL